MPVVDDKYVEDLKKKGRKVPRISTLYGMDRIFKEIYGIPSYIPVSLVCLLEHGVNFQFSNFYERLILSKNEMIFLDNSHRSIEFTIQTKKKAYPIGPLYPKYRKVKGISLKSERIGTLAFPAHSNSQIDFSKGYENYVKDLKSLPAKYHPIVICMYYYDILSDRHLIFIDAGFEVITNGYIGDPLFPDRLYENLSSFKYVTSNHAGSYAYYALEFGIPFFLYGGDISSEFSKIGNLNGLDLNKYMKEDFLMKFSNLMKFDVEGEVAITPELIECIEFINDDKNILSSDQVKNLVINNWKSLLFKKTKSVIRNFFNN